MIRSITVRFVFTAPTNGHHLLTADDLLSAIRDSYGQESGVEIVLIEADET